ncbi:hypothetical protein Ae201684P_016029 [Aphanomyces euteiches]|nr:hypothetical protein Ae201684P_016029 [Aphanomyces euteiches]
MAVSVVGCAVGGRSLEVSTVAAWMQWKPEAIALQEMSISVLRVRMVAFNVFNSVDPKLHQRNPRAPQQLHQQLNHPAPTKYSRAPSAKRSFRWFTWC